MLGKVRTCTLCTYEYVRVIWIPFCCKIRVVKALLGLSRDCRGNPFVNYLDDLPHRDVRRGFATYDRRFAPRYSTHSYAIYIIYISVVLTESRANFWSVIRSCMDFHRFSRRRCFAAGENKIATRVWRAYVRFRVYIEGIPVGEKIELVRKKIGCLGIQKFRDAIWRNRGAYSRKPERRIFCVANYDPARPREILKVDRKLSRYGVVLAVLARTLIPSSIFQAFTARELE